MTGQGERMGIYLLDIFGNEILVHVEGPGCFNPQAAGCAGQAPAHPLAHRPQQDGRILLRIERVSRHRHGQDQAGHGQATPRRRVARETILDATRLGRRHRAAGAGHGLERLQQQGHRRHRTCRGRWQRLLRRPGRQVRLLPTARREGHARAVDAERHDRAAGRTCRLRRLPRVSTWHHCPQHHAAGHAAGAEQADALVRPDAKLQLPRRGPAGLRPELCSRATIIGKEAGKKLNLAGDLNACFNTSYVELRRRAMFKSWGRGPPLC